MNKVGSKMGFGGSQKYGPPTIPKTPSPTINNTLKSKCNKTFDNPIKYAIAWSVCLIYSTVVYIYKLLNKDETKPSYKMWLISCGVTCVLSIIVAFVLYFITHAATFILHVLLFYACIVVALLGIGLSASGMLFFDKEGSKTH